MKKGKNTEISAQWARPLIWMSAVKGFMKNKNPIPIKKLYFRWKVNNILFNIFSLRLVSPFRFILNFSECRQTDFNLFAFRFAKIKEMFTTTSAAKPTKGDLKEGFGGRDIPFESQKKMRMAFKMLNLNEHSFLFRPHSQCWPIIISQRMVREWSNDSQFWWCTFSWCYDHRD